MFVRIPPNTLLFVSEVLSLISALRKIVIAALKERETGPAVKIVARFDWKWHAIHTLNELRQATKNFDNLQISKDDQGILQSSIRIDFPSRIHTITQEDIQVVYQAHLSKMREKRTRNTSQYG